MHRRWLLPERHLSATSTAARVSTHHRFRPLEPGLVALAVAAMSLMLPQATLAQASTPAIEVRGRCADAAAVSATLAARVGARAEVSAVIVCGETITIEIGIRTRESVEARSLTLGAEDLEQVGDAIALVVLVALEPPQSEVAAPDVAPPDNAEGQANAPTVEPEPPASATAIAGPEAAVQAWAWTEPTLDAWEMHAGGFASGGALSGLAIGGDVGVAYRLGPIASLISDVRVWGPRTVDFSPRGSVEILPLALRVGACVRRGISLHGAKSVELGACSALLVGATGAFASGFDGDGLTEWQLRLAASVGAQLAFVWGAFLARVEAEVGANLVSPSFFVLVDGTSRVFAERVGAFWAGLGVCLGVRWPG